MEKGRYAAAGVDIEAGERAVERIKAVVAATGTPAATGAGVLGGIGSFGGADAAHDIAADAGCPACATTTVAQVLLAVVAATNGEEYVTEELSGRILALVNGMQAELDAMN